MGLQGDEMLELDQIRYELSEAKTNLREVGESL